MTTTRREFLANTTAVAAVTAVMSPKVIASTLVRNTKYPRTIIGYCWPQTVRPGQSLDVMISTHRKGSYLADLVRIICGDNMSDPTMYKEEELTAPFSGMHPGRHQPIYIGSYVEISPNEALDRVESFTVQAKFYPTLLPGQEKTIPGTSEKPTAGEQYLISRWDNQQKRGWGLLIDDQGKLAFILGDGEQIHRTTLSKPLMIKQWFSVVVSYDAHTQRVRIAAEAVADSPMDKLAWPRKQVEKQCPESITLIQAGPLRFAACTDGPGNGPRLRPGGCFNGKLDRVRMTAGVLTEQQATSMAGSDIPNEMAKKTIGFWDFGIGIDTIDIVDLSPNQLNGIMVNVPMRAVTGVDWDGTEDDWRQRPDHYSAIYFHDDDLYDAEWQVDFSYQIPKDLRSSIYAIRIRHGDSEEYIPFFVAPPKNKITSPLALLLPTATYNAYTNSKQYWQTIPQQGDEVSDRFKNIDKDWFWPMLLQNAEDAYFLQNNLPELGKGVYHFHTDGTLYAIASQKHPNMTIKPKNTVWTLVADTYITDWLERIGTEYDIITDDLLQQEGIDLLKRYRVVMTGNHPEYYSTEMLDAVAHYQEIGGRLMYMGGNGFYNVAGFHRQLPGLIEVRKTGLSSIADLDWEHYELRHAADGVNGGLWKDNARPANQYVGVHYSHATFSKSDPYKRLPDSYHPRAAFIFAGVNNEIFGDYGISGNGAAGQEYDHINYEMGTPAHALHLASASNSEAAESEECWQQGHEHGADMVFFEAPKGGAVFSTGSMAWVGALSHNHYDNDVARITENVLRHFLNKTTIQFP